MQIRNPRSTGRLTTRDEYDDLLACRVKMLGLDLSVVECGDSETYNKIRRQCTSCGFRQSCALDLKRDPHNPVWESYCPNAEALISLTNGW
jgi:hypothetical protein